MFPNPQNMGKDTLKGTKAFNSTISIQQSLMSKGHLRVDLYCFTVSGAVQ